MAQPKVQDTRCIQCGCTDRHACLDPNTNQGCHWLRLDRESGQGVCSCCKFAVQRWDSGNRNRLNQGNAGKMRIDSVPDRPKFIRAKTDDKGRLMCPLCDGKEFYKGPEAGVNINLLCRCGAEWNHTPLGFEPINAVAA